MKRTLLLLTIILMIASCNESPTDPFGGSDSGMARLSGVARNQQGSALSGVNISLTDLTRGEIVRTTMTNRQGLYTMGRIPPGRYRLWARLGQSAAAPFETDIELREGENSFNLTI